MLTLADVRRRRQRAQRGSALIEYVVLTVVVVFLAAAVVGGVNLQVASVFTTTASDLDTQAAYFQGGGPTGGGGNGGYGTGFTPPAGAGLIDDFEGSDGPLRGLGSLNGPWPCSEMACPNGWWESWQYGNPEGIGFSVSGSEQFAIGGGPSDMADYGMVYTVNPAQSAGIGIRVSGTGSNVQGYFLITDQSPSGQAQASIIRRDPGGAYRLLSSVIWPVPPATFVWFTLRAYGNVISGSIQNKPAAFSGDQATLEIPIPAVVDPTPIASGQPALAAGLAYHTGPATAAQGSVGFHADANCGCFRVGLVGQGPPGWALNGGLGSGQWTTATANTGVKSVEVGSSVASDGYWYLSDSGGGEISMALVPNTTYVVCGAIQTASVTGNGASIHLTERNSGGSPVADHVGPLVTNSPAFAPYTYTFTSAATASSALVHLELNGAGRAWFDSIWVAPGSSC